MGSRRFRYASRRRRHGARGAVATGWAFRRSGAIPLSPRLDRRITRYGGDARTLAADGRGAHLGAGQGCGVGAEGARRVPDLRGAGARSPRGAPLRPHPAPCAVPCLGAGAEGGRAHGARGPRARWTAEPRGHPRRGSLRAGGRSRGGAGDEPQGPAHRPPIRAASTQRAASMQRAGGEGGARMGEAVERGIARQRGGQPMPEGVRSHMESRFRADFQPRPDPCRRSRRRRAQPLTSKPVRSRPAGTSSSAPASTFPGAARGDR